LKLLNEGINCPRCQKYVDEIHQNRPILVKDLPNFGKPVYLKVPRRQFECNVKENDRSIRIFIPPTYKTLKEYIYRRVVATNIEQVCREEQVKYDEVKVYLTT